MKTERRSFMPLDADIDDGKLEELAASKGVRALVSPVANGTGAGEGTEPSRDDLDRETPKEGAKQTVFKKSGVVLPQYAWTNLRLEAARRGTTVQFILMSGLRREGIHIDDKDMVEDGRRHR